MYSFGVLIASLISKHKNSVNRFGEWVKTSPVHTMILLIILLLYLFAMLPELFLMYSGDVWFNWFMAVNCFLAFPLFAYVEIAIKRLILFGRD